MPSLADDPLTPVTSRIIAAAVNVHRALGPGLLESAYVSCLAYELSCASLPCELQKEVPLVYRGVRIDCAYRADIFVGEQIIIEVKALETLAPIHIRQLHTYLRLSGRRVGLLLNFGAPTMKQGIKRLVNGYPAGTRSESLPP